MAETAPKACYSGVALLRKIAGIVPYTTAAIDVKRILIRRFNDQKKMSRTDFNQLLEAGAHFGHLKRKWNPKMAPYIFMEKNGIHIIDLHKTVAKIDEAAAALKTNPNELAAKIEQQVNDMRALNKKLEKMGAKVAAMQMVDLFNVSRNIKGVEVVATKLDDASADMLRTMGDDIKGKKDNMVAVLSAVNGDKVSLLCVCGAEAVKKGAHAGKIIKEVAKIVGGGGGGRPDSATAGGKNPAKLEEALEAVNNIVDAML